MQNGIVRFVSRWNKTRNFTATKEEALFHLVEEVGELAAQFVNRDSGRNAYDEHEVKDAIGDSMMHLVMLANLYGFDLEELVMQIINDQEEMLQQREKKGKSK